VTNSVLVASAPLRWTPRLTAIAVGADLLLAADGGADHLARIGLRPSAVIGDLDSISGPTRAWLGEAAMVARPDQERTDLDKALAYALEDLALAELTVLAATGGRIDHEQANLGLLARLAMGAYLRFESDRHTLIAVLGQISLAAAPGETWSFWTYVPAARVWLDGVRWPVYGETLHITDRPSISNVAVAEQVTVRSEGGSVIVMRQRVR
jgi:thiamine pyrophosphokinase